MYPFKNKDEKYIKLPIELRDFAGLDAYTKTIYMILCSYEDCWVSIRTIHKFTGVSIERINKSIKQLVMYNMISYIPGYSFKTGKTQSNKYTIIHKSLWNTKPTVSPRSTVKQVKHEDSPVSPGDTVQYRQEGSSIITYNNYNPSVSPGSTMGIRIYHDETKSLISMPMSQSEVESLGVNCSLTDSVTASQIKKCIGQRHIPKEFIALFILSFMNNRYMDQEKQWVLEDLSKMINQKDTISKIIDLYKTQWNKENEL